MTSRDGRSFQPSLVALSLFEGHRIVLLSPAVGLWRGGPLPGALVGPGEDIGELEILGELHRLVAPTDVAGAVVDDPQRPRVAPLAVDYASRLMELDPDATSVAAVAVAAEASTSGGLVFRSPLSGRFYTRATPDKPAFVREGDTVRNGQTVALLEVMKTFNRVVYGSPDLPAEARVKRVVPANESDIDEGDAILELEPIE